VAGDEPLYRVLGALEGNPRQTPSGWEARCPGPNHQHDDRHPSLSIGLGNDGRVLLKCFAGCALEDIVSRLGLKTRDLFPQVVDNVRRINYRLKSNGQLHAVHVREEHGEEKKMWWERPDGQRGLNGTHTADLPLYGVDDLPADGVVIVTEGEKSAQALLDAGAIAVGTVTGASGTPSESTLRPLQGRVVWLWPDNDQQGLEHMQRISRLIQPEPVLLHWADAPPKGDAADFLAGGGKVTDIGLLRPASPPRDEHSVITLDQLMRVEFPMIRWAVPQVLPAGLFLMAGKPKLGKSTFWLNVGLDIARGTPVLGKIPAERGAVLILALEESARRLQGRAAQMLGDARPPSTLTLATKWPRQDQGGMTELATWLEHAENPRLVVIDTLKRFQPPQETRGKRLFDVDYDSVIGLTELAMTYNIAVILVGHTNKTDPEDPMDLISGTLGLSAAADGVMVMKRERGQATASLFVTGRDVEEQDLALKRDDDDLSWTLLGDTAKYQMSQERFSLLDVIEQQPGMKPGEIADALGWLVRRVRRLLFDMVHAGQVRLRDGRYYPPVEQNPLLFLDRHGPDDSSAAT